MYRIGRSLPNTIKSCKVLKTLLFSFNIVVFNINSHLKFVS